jgi:hypothetical protein
MSPFVFRKFGIPMAIAVLGMAGCSGSDVKDLASSVKEAASQGMQSVSETAQQVKDDVSEAARGATDTVSEGLDLAGSMNLVVNQPVQVGACYASFVPAGAGREGVLQLQSYRDAEGESFPSVFVRSQCAAASVAELAGQTIPAQMFVQLQQDGPIWHAELEPVQLKITSVQDKLLNAELAGGTLLDTGSGTTQPVQGSFQGVLQ